MLNYIKNFIKKMINILIFYKKFYNILIKQKNYYNNQLVV